jgi:SAM-dependent methyltransferase
MKPFVVEFGKDGNAPPAPDGRLDAPAFRRNHEAIWSAVGGFLSDKTGDVLELGSGTGQHAVTFAQRTPKLTWWPSDIYESHLTSIAAWRREAELENLRAPQRIDLTDPEWRWHADDGNSRPLAAMLCINVLHISPWIVSQNLIRGAARFLGADGRLFVYGPFMREGVHTAPSNAAFDTSLRAENSAWGIRDLRDLSAIAQEHGLILADAIPMPANNFVLVFARPSDQT